MLTAQLSEYEVISLQVLWKLKPFVSRQVHSGASDRHSLCLTSMEGNILPSALLGKFSPW